MSQSLAEFHQEEVNHGAILQSSCTFRTSLLMDQHIGALAASEQVERSTLIRAAVHEYLTARGINPRLPLSYQTQKEALAAAG